MQESEGKGERGRDGLTYKDFEEARGISERLRISGI
jgi:hypothetical protein